MPAIHQRWDANFRPFPNTEVYITGLKDDLIILDSLQSPRRITLRASNGGEYSILLKSEDDLRKGARIMDFHLLVNQYLNQSPEGRQRHLKIRTYSVIPLSHESGIIEWVPNLEKIADIIQGEYLTFKNLY